MNWEESKALTPLKRVFLKEFFDRERRFFLTGGSALGIFYLQHRLSYDLDFFTTDEAVDWHVLDNETRSIAGAIGAQRETITAAPTFRPLLPSSKWLHRTGPSCRSESEGRWAGPCDDILHPIASRD